MKRRRLQRFWLDLKRRRMFSTGALYVVVAWAFVQAASIAFPVFGIPDSVMRAVLVAAFAGFPVVLVLAWVFDVTRGGIRVTEPIDEKYPRNIRPPRWWVRPLVAAPLLALIVGGTVWLWTSRLAHTGDTEFTRQLRPDELPIIAVLPLENLTGRKDLAWTGAAVATLVRDDLAQSHFIAVVSAARTMRLAGEHKDMQSLFSAAADEGITHVLSGEVLRTRKGLTVTSRLTDLRRNVELGANRQEALQPDEALSFSTAIASVVKQGLGLPGTEKVDVFAANFASHNIAAYEAFIAGMQDFLAFDYTDARQSFEVAVQKAPDFAMARYRLAHTLASLGDTDGALQQIEAAKRAAVRLPSRERAYIDAADAYFKRDYPQAERQYRSLLEQHPYETEARLLLLYVLIDQDAQRGSPRRGRNADRAGSGRRSGVEFGRRPQPQAGPLRRSRQRGAQDDRDRARQSQRLLPARRIAPVPRQVRGSRRRVPEGAAGRSGFGDAALRLADIEVLRNRPQAAIAQLQPMLAPGNSRRRFGSRPRSTWRRCCVRRDAARRRWLRWIACMPTSPREQVRQALELSTRSRCLLDLRDVARARRTGRRVRGAVAGQFRPLPARARTGGNPGGRCRGGDRDHRCDSRPRPVQPPPTAPNTKPPLTCRVSCACSRGTSRGRSPSLRAAVAKGGYEYDDYALALAGALAQARKRARCTHVRAPGDAARGPVRPQAGPGARAPRRCPAAGATGRLTAAGSLCGIGVICPGRQDKRSVSVANPLSSKSSKNTFTLATPPQNVPCTWRKRTTSSLEMTL